MRSLHDPRYVEMLGLLRRARERHGVQQGELASRLGKGQSYISKIETGERRVDLIELLDICQALGVGVIDVIPGGLRPAIEGPTDG